MGSASQRTTKGKAVPRKRAVRKSTAAVRKAEDSRGGTPGRLTYPISRIIGTALLVVALYLGALLAAPGAGWRAPLNGLAASVGVAYGPLILLAVLLALALLLRPVMLSSAAARRILVGSATTMLVTACILGAFQAGGSIGNGLWSSIVTYVGGGVVLILCVAGLVALILFGVPPRLIGRVTINVSAGLLRMIAAVLFGAVGVAVWLVQKLHSSRRLEAKRDRAPAAVRPPAIAEVSVQPAEDTLEVTQPMLVEPVIQTFREEPVEARPPGDWTLPPLTLLGASPQVEVSELDARNQAKVIEDALESFGVRAYVREINPGPTVTQFALEPGPGTKVSRITSLHNDLALALAAPSIRMEAPVPGQSRLGIEIPNTHAAIVRLRDVMDSGAFYTSKGTLKLALGRDVTGRSVVGDLARMPHLLIAGATGSGKSKCLNSIILGFLFQHTPDELRFLMVDPKMVELKTFDGVPHLIWPVVTEVEKVVGILKYAVAEMERRYKEFSRLGIRNLDGYNRRAVANGEASLPRILVIIDELADLMMAAPEEVEAAICRLAQMARAVGIHLILATQRPSVDVLTGLIKANFPSRIAFAVSSQIDSRVILDMPGAERLLGRGDMLFLGPDSAKPLRVQGTFVSDEETEAVVGHWKEMQPAQYDPQVGRLLETEAAKAQSPHEDPLYAQALELAGSHTRLSTSLLQRKLRVGYNRAARLMDALRESGELDAELDD